MTTVTVLFVLLGLVALGAAVLVVTTSYVVHAALWLAVTFGALAGCYLLLTAELVAWVQVLIYVGAVIVLLLFALMLTHAPTGPSTELTTGNTWCAGGVAAAVAAVLVTTVVAGFSGKVIDLGHVEIGDAEVIGRVIFSHWVLAFEALSVLLLAALVGAIVLSRRGEAAAGGAPAASGAGPAASGSEEPEARD